ncbi:hypothetical protein P152DRAFT_406693, partial [Eremomyces bilateralis CBS 781.70]
VWKAMTDVARISQETVLKTGMFIRLEAVRTEEHQTKYVPLSWAQTTKDLVSW